MNTWEFTAFLTLGSIVTGIIGALTGLGGGFIVVPLLTLCFGVDIRYAIGASLICVIATSSGAAARYVREGYSNIRLGMFLEVATTVGAVAGAFFAPKVPTPVIGGLFGLVLLYASYLTLRRAVEQDAAAAPDRVSAWLEMDSAYPTPQGVVSYRVRHVPEGFGVMTVAGMLSGLLGIGSGLVKVVALDQVMGLPFKVCATTSSFMIGVTAAASAGVHLSRGYIDPALAMPVMLGVLCGAFLGARILPGAPPRRLRLLFAGLLAAVAAEMLYTSAAGRI
jgi:uncharacterized membrane protein YfcA